MSQNMRRDALLLGRHGKHLERRRIGHGDHVRLLDAGEAVDRRAVEAHALLERALELAVGHGEALQNAEHVGEPEADELDVALLDRLEDVLFGHPISHVSLLLAFAAREAAPVTQDVTDERAGCCLAQVEGPRPTPGWDAIDDQYVYIFPYGRCCTGTA